MRVDDYVIHMKGEPADKYARQPGHWVIASLTQTMGWDRETQIVTFEGHKILVLGYGDELQFLPAIAVNYSDRAITKLEAQRLITRFLSVLNWAEGVGSISIENWIGGSRPIRTRARNGVNYTTSYFRITYLPQYLSDELCRALALYREGMGLRHVHAGYSFLSFYKVINLVHRSGRDQKAWIRDNIPSLAQDMQDKAVKLAAEYHERIEDFLYISCRCAVAHAGEDSNMDPDNIEDSLRLQKGNPIIAALAEYMVSSHFELPTKQQIWQRHYYEVAGFAEVFGEDQVFRIQENEFIPRRAIAIPEPISVRQWHDKRYGVFENLNTRVRGISGGQILIECSSPDRLFIVELIVDLIENRFFLDIENPVIREGAEKQHIRYRIDHLRYLDDLIGNGEEEIFLSESNICLGRKDANLPVNIDQQKTHEHMQAQIEQLEAELL